MGASGLTDCMEILHLMQWDLPLIIELPYLFPIYHMDVTNIVCQVITYLYTF